MTYKKDIARLEVAVANHRRMKELSPLNPISMMAFYGSKVSGSDDANSLHRITSSLKSYEIEQESPLIKEFEEMRMQGGQLESLTINSGPSHSSNA